LRRPFVADAVFLHVIKMTLAFVCIKFYSKEATPQAFATGVDWRLIPAAVLILFALWILAGLALACSTRLDVIPTLAICSGLFLLGIMSDFIFGRFVGHGSWLGSAICSVLYTITPNWQLF